MSVQILIRPYFEGHLDDDRYEAFQIDGVYYFTCWLCGTHTLMDVGMDVALQGPSLAIVGAICPECADQPPTTLVEAVRAHAGLPSALVAEFLEYTSAPSAPRPSSN